MRSSRRAFIQGAGLGALALSLSRCTPEVTGGPKPDTPDAPREPGAPRDPDAPLEPGAPRDPDAPLEPGAPREPGERPNILLITTDYQSGLDVPSIGHRFLEMPTLDRLCREGAVFRRHLSTAPICVPARNTWITGQYPHTHGKWENVGGWVPESSPVLMEELSARGYQTTAVGKLHLGFPDDAPLGGFDRWVSADRKGNFGAAGQQDDYAAFLAERGLVRDDYLRMGVEAPMPHVYDWPWDESWHIDHYVGARALEIVERSELREPWFLWVSFNGPHNPWDPPARCSAPYKEMDLPLGHTFPGELDTKPTDHTRLRFNYTGEIAHLIDADYRRRDQIIHAIRAGHYGNLTFIDEQMGRVIDALERRGELDETVVFWTSDHGSHLGDHDLIHKGTHYDSSARVPLVVRSPARVEAGVRDGFSAHVDLMPTILSLAGAPLPEAMEGRDLTPLFGDVEASVQDEVFIEVRGSTSIVTDRWKMGLYPHDGEGDLYDLDDDPFELINRFEDGDYRGIRDELSERIRDFAPVWPPAFSVVDR